MMSPSARRRQINGATEAYQKMAAPGSPLAIYAGSDGKATADLYARLTALGPAGEIATNVFRAMKCSERAKVYRGGGYRGEAYDRKEWSIGNLCRTLVKHGDALGIVWGWAADQEQEFHNQVLYVELPSGQVSFHSHARGEGPDYTKPWDHAVGSGPQRIAKWCEQLLG